MTLSQMKKNANLAMRKFNFDIRKGRVKKLLTCYKNPSIAKREAWERIQNEALESDLDTGLRIITYNANMFTCAYVYVDKETGVLKFRYYTPNYTVEIDYNSEI